MAVSVLGVVFVVLQFGTIGLLISAFFWIPYTEVVWPRVIGAVLFASGLATMIAGIVYFQVNNDGKPMNIVPDVPEETKLVVQGLWGFVRHPMYCALLQLSLGLCCYHQHWAVFIIWGGFVVILFTKAKYEEAMLKVVFAEYEAYRSASCMLFPVPCFRYVRPEATQAVAP
jgi:protein-S-isoprenylcysteine O-methyltransferase Ste14